MGEISKSEAVEKIQYWAEYLERIADGDINDSDFKDALSAITIPVMKERLEFNEDDETFTYKLIRPVGEGENKKEVLIIKQLTLQEKEFVDKYKDRNVEMTEAMMAAASGIPLGKVGQLVGRDVTVIGCVCNYFFS